MQTVPIAANQVEAWNDVFAREHDIDEYYGRSGILIRWIEASRLRAIHDLLQAEPRHTILEVGCGGGHVLRLFPQNTLIGVDVSGEMLRRAERNLQGYHVELRKSELADAGFPAGRFDRMICTEVLEHVLDPDALLAEMARLLAPGGRLVVTLPNDALILRLKAIVRRSGLGLLPLFRRVSWGGDKYHLHAWRPGQMRELLSKRFVVMSAKAIPRPALPVRYAFACTLPRAGKNPRFPGALS